MSQPRRRSPVEVRIGAPVSGCEVSVHVLARTARGNILERSKLDVDYEWLITREPIMCSNPECRKRNWTAPRAARLQFIVAPLRNRLFCSEECMREVWRVNQRIASHRSTGADTGAPPESPSKQRLFDLVLEEPCRAFDLQPLDSRPQFKIPEAAIGRGLALRCTVRLKETGKVVGTATSTPRVVIASPPAPPARPMIKPQASVPGLPVRVATYNILAEIYATKVVYPYCPLWALLWAYRAPRLVRELTSFGADIMALQEVQLDHFNTTLRPALEQAGFGVLFKSKTRDPGMEGKVDGCALVFRLDAWELVDSREVEYNAVASAHARGRQSLSGRPLSREGLQRLSRGQIAQLAMLRSRRQLGKVICVANTHIFWDPEYADVKLWQTLVLTQEIQGFLAGRWAPLLVFGDFNSTPDSAVYHLLCQGRVPSGHPDLRIDPARVLPPPHLLSQPLRLVSAHRAVTGSEPTATNFTGNYQGVLDYLFVDPAAVVPTAVMQVPEPGELPGPLPCPQYPSDHVPMVADLVLVDHPR